MTSTSVEYLIRPDRRRSRRGVAQPSASAPKRMGEDILSGAPRPVSPGPSPLGDPACSFDHATAVLFDDPEDCWKTHPAHIHIQTDRYDRSPRRRRFINIYDLVCIFLAIIPGHHGSCTIFLVGAKDIADECNSCNQYWKIGTIYKVAAEAEWNSSGKNEIEVDLKEN